MGSAAARWRTGTDALASLQRYFQLMMDIDGNGLVTLEEMLAMVGQCRQISYTLTTKDGIALQDVLAKVVASVRKHSVCTTCSSCSVVGRAGVAGPGRS